MEKKIWTKNSNSFFADLKRYNFHSSRMVVCFFSFFFYSFLQRENRHKKIEPRSLKINTGIFSRVSSSSRKNFNNAT